MPLEGEKTKKVETGGYWRRVDFQKWWEGAHQSNAEKGILTKPFELYTEFLLHLRGRIIKEHPEFETEDIYSRKQVDHLVNSILNTAKPGWNQFCEMYDEMFVEVPPQQTELDTKGDVAARVRAREGSIALEQRRRNGALPPPGTWP